MAPDSTNLLMSVSKSVTSVVCGSLVAAGRLSPDDLVTSHVPELAGTSWDGADGAAVALQRPVCNPYHPKHSGPLTPEAGVSS